MDPQGTTGVRVVVSRSHRVVCLLAAAAAVAFLVGLLVVGAGWADPAPQLIAAVIFALLAVGGCPVVDVLRGVRLPPAVGGDTESVAHVPDRVG